MRRRSKTGGEPAKARHRKTVTLKRPGVPKSARRRSSSGGGLSEQVALFKRERDELLEQQKAMADVLKVISSSPGELEPVFQAMLENAVRICGAQFGNLALFDGGELRLAAMHNAPRALAELRRRDPVIDLKRSVAGPVVTTKQVNHVRDLAAQEPYAGSALAKVGGARTALSVPMLREDTLVGTVNIYHLDVLPFTDKQIELIKNFAAQAVIAIENTRLLNELRQSLEQQTATTDVLSVISSSPGELEPVFQAMLENATRICEAKFGTMYFRESEGFRAVAMHGAPPAYTELRLHKLVHPGPATGIGRVLQTKQAVQIEDASKDQGYSERDPMRVSAVELGGVRTLLDVPMLKEDEVIGVVAIYRDVVRPFTDKQVALVQNFANQAVIAIENTRLLNELRQRTDDLTESLEQQTATAEILSVISKSLSDTQPVFDAIVQSGVRLFSGAAISIALVDGDEVKAVAIAESDPARAEAWRRRFPVPLTRAYIHSTAIIDRKMLDISDVEHAPADMGAGKQNFLRSGYRAVTIMPMMRDDVAIGGLSVVRLEPGPLSDKQLAVLRTFAAQAVIAIENARLLNELRQRTDDLTESLEQQTATSEILSVISRSPGELDPVFDAMLENAIALCDAKTGNLFLYDGEEYLAYLRINSRLEPSLRNRVSGSEKRNFAGRDKSTEPAPKKKWSSAETLRSHTTPPIRGNTVKA